MTRPFAGVCAAGILSTMAVSASPAAPVGDVTVRAYNTYGLPAADIQTASRTVRTLFSTVAIDTRWRNCRIVGRTSSAAADQCGDPVAPNEVIVRVVGAARRSEPEAMLGYSLIDPVLRTGTLATIYADRVGALSRTLDVDRGTMLGLAVAHEIGHLLLGTHRHSGFGLMRDAWSGHVIVGNRGEDWRFTRQQGVEMRSALGARLLADPRSAGTERQK